MTTTQVRITGSGTWGNVTKDSKGSASKSTTIVGATPKPNELTQVLRASNEWTNAGGTGTAATRANKVAKGVGFELREN